jgi:hypothetical protein
MRKALCVILLAWNSASAGAAERVLSPPEVRALLDGMKTRYESVRDYSCELERQERVKEKIRVESGIRVRFMKPFSIYLRWTKEAKGKEALYCQGHYNDRVVYHSGGFFRCITLKLAPRGSLAMRGNRHPITEAHIGHFIAVIEHEALRGLERGEGTVRSQGVVSHDGRTASRYRAEFPEGYYARVVDVDIDAELGLPIRIEARDAGGALLEMYHFTDIRLNPGFTGNDFDINNPEYGF